MGICKIKDKALIRAIVERYNSGETARAIERSIGVGRGIVGGVIVRNGEKLHSRSETNRKYQANENCFDIFSPDSMYFAGWIMADGNIRKDGKMLQVKISKKDIELLESFKRFTGYTGQIEHRSYVFTGIKKDKPPKVLDTISIRITCPRIVQALKRFGVISNKARRASIPEEILNSPLSVFFFRGLMDGDGAFGIRHGVFSSGKTWANFCANPRIATAFKEWCRIHAGTNGNIAKRSSSSWVVQYSSKDSMKLWSLIYGSPLGMRLERKATIFKHLQATS